MLHRPPQDIYASHLLSYRGYPLWVPEPDSQLLEWKRPDGLAIGDVGVVHPGGGYFDVLFNICLPPDHPFHRAVGVPQGFIPVELEDGDIEITPNKEACGYMTSSSVTSVETPAIQSGSSVLDLEFTLHPKEGALLILPEGADRHLLRNKSCFLDHMIRYGANWYRFARERRGWIIDRDALYLITGFYKTRSWSLGAYDDITTTGGLPAKFRATQIGRDNIDVRSAYAWQTAHPSNRRIGPVRNGGATRNQAVIICGFKIALRDVTPKAPCLCGLVPGNFPRRRTSTGILEKRTTSNLVTGQVPNAVLHEQVVREPIEIRRFPEVSRVFHPCDVINEYLLRQEPTANIAISHDSDWISLLDSGLLAPDELVREERLKKALSRTCNPRSQGDVVYLERKSASDTLDRSSATEAGRSMGQVLRRLRLVVPRKFCRRKRQELEVDQESQHPDASPRPLSMTEMDKPGRISRPSIDDMSLGTEIEKGLQTKWSEQFEQTLWRSPRKRAAIMEGVAGSSVDPLPVTQERLPRKKVADAEDISDSSIGLLPFTQEKLPRKKAVHAEDTSGLSVVPPLVPQHKLRKSRPTVDSALSEQEGGEDARPRQARQPRKRGRGVSEVFPFAGGPSGA